MVKMGNDREADRNLQHLYRWSDVIHTEVIPKVKTSNDIPQRKIIEKNEEQWIFILALLPRVENKGKI